MPGSLFHRVYDAGHLIEEVPFSDPLALFAPLAADPYALLLDSATANPQKPTDLHGRWTYIAADPFATVEKREGTAFLNGVEAGDSGFDLLARQLDTLSLEPDWPSEAGLPPFTGGFAGFFGYEMGAELEALPTRKPWDQRDNSTTPSPPDMALGAYDCVVAFDCVARRTFIVSTGLPETTPAARAVRAEARAARWRARLALNPALPPLHWPAEPAPKNIIAATTNRTQHEAAVARIVDYIHAGDIFQANLSQRFEARLQNNDSAFTLYRRLRTLSLAPYAGFFNFSDGALLSSSPEQFLTTDGRTVETRPIKGTRPRGQTPEQDADFAIALVGSEKDHAENIMIVDLLRNDLSRVCKDGSMHVKALCALESFATVHHLVSTVRATRRDNITNVDLLRACFPGGSITGAPKIRAMEIIGELEQHARGPYCGSLGFMSFSGTMNTNISIRTITVIGEQVTFQAGGGIVADSNPAEEYEEVIAKASALCDAVRGVRPEKSDKAGQARA